VPGPLHAGATRDHHLGEALRSRGFAYGTVLAASGALVVAAASGQGALIVLGAPVAVIAAALLAVVFTASQRAADDFWRSFADSVGLVLHGSSEEVTAYTPLLAAGHRRRYDRWLSGTIGGKKAGLGHYTWQREDMARGENGLRDGGVVERGRHTVVVIDIEPEGVPWLSGVYLHPRTGVGPLQRDRWLRNSGLVELETESTVVGERYRLRVEPCVDPVRVRELLSPTLVDRLARDPAKPGFEYRAGVLVVFEDGHAGDAGSLVALMEAARAIAVRIADEVAEEKSVAPPSATG
jgi:hypothetical protein